MAPTPAYPGSEAYGQTRARVEDYFDRTATETWARLTSDAPVSRIRQTVREGRDAMRALMLTRLPEDLTGLRILDAGCGPGQMSQELARRGAQVVAVDISPALVSIAVERMPKDLQGQVSFASGDMLDAGLGQFDAALAMDSLIYYRRADLARAIEALRPRVGQTIFTVPPKTPLLMAMWYAGKAFPRSDRSPIMVPQGARDLRQMGAEHVGRVARGFYISEAWEARR